MKRIKNFFVLICSMLFISGCNRTNSEDIFNTDVQADYPTYVQTTNEKKETICTASDLFGHDTEYSGSDEYIIELSNSYENIENLAVITYKRPLDFFNSSKNVLKWEIQPESMYSLYKEAIGSDELLGHTVDLYDTIKDVDGNGDFEYLVASRFGFSDAKDSLIIFDNDADGNLKIVYNSDEDSELNLFDFQHITGHFYECPINSTTALNGLFYKPIYSENGKFELIDDNIFYTAWWSNICVRNICYKINFDGETYSLQQISKLGWKAETIYENEEPTNKCRIIYTDFGN